MSVVINVIAPSLATFVTTLYYCAFLILSDKYASFLYSKGLLTRLKSSIMEGGATGRKGWSVLMENFVNALTTFSIPIWYIVTTLLPIIDRLDYSFKPIQTWISLCGIYVCFDFCYYITHRIVHEVPWLYKAIHKRHHEFTNIDSYTTGRADVIENIIFTSPGMLLWGYLCINLVAIPNAWMILIPAVSLLHDFALAHIGYYDTFLLHLINPVAFIWQYTLFSLKFSTRHELHHLTLTKNYSPFTPWMDEIFGTGVSYKKEQYKVTYAGEQKK